MCSFFQESLKPEIFWTALASIGTLSAVLIALFLPTYNEAKRVKKVARLIEGEVSRNYKIAKNADSQHTITMPDGSAATIVLSAQETERLLNIELWNQYKFKLADDRPESYSKYQNINQHIEALSNLSKIPEKLKPVMFHGEISSFIEKCQKELKLD